MRGGKTLPDTRTGAVHLTDIPDTVNWPEARYLFVEKIGPFQTNAPQAWQELHRHIYPQLLSTPNKDLFQPVEDGAADLPCRGCCDR